MKKNRCFSTSPVRYKFIRNLLLFCFLTTFSITQLYAKDYAQSKKISINVNDATFASIFKEIEEKSEFYFFYDDNEIDVSRKVSLSINKSDIHEILNILFDGSEIKYETEDRSIILSKQKIERETELNTQQEQKNISGIVKDQQGVPLIGVNVLIKNSKKGTVTNLEGEFEIIANDDDVIIFSYVGFQTKEIQIKESLGINNKINVTLEEAVDALQDLIVTGYNTVIEKKVTGSVSKLETENLPSIETKIDDMLQGLIPGLAVINTSGEVGSVPVVKIRGTPTLTGNSSPLWVVDGVVLEDPVPLTPTELNSPDIVNRIGNALSGINPQDIKTITVLKDASATAIYGVRAAGGVIVLTTKRGVKGAPVVNLSLSTTLALRPTYDDFNLMNSKERIDIEKFYFESGLQYYNADANINSVGLAGAYARYKSRELETWDEFQEEVRKAQVYNTDWFDVLYRDALGLNSNFNISGGSEKVNYYASLNMLSQEGSDKLTSNRRYNGSIKLNTQLTDNFNLEFYLSLYATKRSSYPLSLVPSGISNFTRQTPTPFDYALNTSRTFPLKNSDGSYYMYRGHNDFYLFNIMHEYDNSNQTAKTNGTTARISLDYDIMDNFRAFGVLNYTSSNQLDETYYKENTNQVAGIRRSNFGEPAPADSNLPKGGVIFSNSNMQEYYMGRIALEYEPFSTNFHEFKVYTGGEYRVNKYRGDNVIGWGYLHDRGKVISTDENIGEELAGAPYLKIRDFSTKSASYFGVATYSILGRYILNFNVRYDGSNLFGSNPKYRWEPARSISGRWNIMEEEFMKNSPFNNLALRGSYGLQGTTNTQSTPQIVASFLNPAHWSKLNLLGISSPSNPNLRWEKTYNTNIGVDFAIFNARILGAVDLYNRKSKDLITNTRISEVNGFSTLPINFADVSNKGIEFGITTKNIRNPSPGFNWSTTINFAYNKNEVIKVNTDPVVSRLLSPYPYKPDAAIVGKPLNSLYSVNFDYLDDEGVAHFKLANGETTVAKRDLQFNFEDLVYNGPLEAPYQGGVSNLFELGNFKLSSLFTYGFGNYFRKEEILESWMYSPDQNLNKELVNAWREPGDESFTNIPHIVNETGARNHKYYWNKSDIRVIKGDYLRLSNVTLQYYLPESLLKSLKLSKAFVQIEGNNLWLLADNALDGYDPETFPYKSLPIPKSYLFSINLTF